MQTFYLDKLFTYINFLLMQTFYLYKLFTYANFYLNKRPINKTKTKLILLWERPGKTKSRTPTHCRR